MKTRTAQQFDLCSYYWVFIVLYCNNLWRLWYRMLRHYIIWNDYMKLCMMQQKEAPSFTILRQKEGNLICCVFFSRWVQLCFIYCKYKHPNSKLKSWNPKIHRYRLSSILSWSCERPQLQFMFPGFLKLLPCLLFKLVVTKSRHLETDFEVIY